MSENPIIIERKDCPYRTDMEKCFLSDKDCSSVDEETCKQHIQKALAKQVEKEPVTKVVEIPGYGDNYAYAVSSVELRCPTCHKYIGVPEFFPRYCDNCGQAIVGGWVDL